MTNNPWFPSPTPPLATLTADLDALELAEATARNRSKGSAAARNLKKKKVVDDLTELKGYVQSIVNQSPDKEIAIIECAGMSTRQLMPRQKPALEALMGPSPGQVIVRAKAVGKRAAAYEWQVAVSGNAWSTIGTTTVAETSVPGLTAGTTYLFRLRTTVKNTTGDWSQSVSYLVH
jgi:hypothetical protein